MNKPHTSTLPKASCWHNGELVPAEQATVSVFDHGLLYGDGVFEGLRFYNTKAFKIERHLQRLRRSLKVLGITIEYSNEQLIEGVKSCIEDLGMQDGYLRILVTRGEGNLGLNPTSCPQSNVFILAAQLELASSEVVQRGLKLITSSVTRTVGTGVDSRVKSLNYLHSIMAKMESNHANADDALLLNQQGKVAECSAANIFIVRDGKLITPPCTDGALEGITRETVIELALEKGVEVCEQSLTTWDIYTADECFVTGSGARLMPIASLDGRNIEAVNGPVFQTLFDAFMSKVRS